MQVEVSMKDKKKAERVTKICPSAGNKGRELLSIAMKDAAGDKFISYNPENITLY